MTNQTLNLNPRLRKIAELVPPNRCTADIGTDHGYIPIELINNGVTPHGIASDINKGPLLRAQANIQKHNLESYIETRLGSGLSTLSAGDAEVIIIAGMGGILISEILKASKDVANSAKLLILQPMTAVTELRQYLVEDGFKIETEHLVAEEDKLYNIIVASPDGSCHYTLAELYLGKNLDKTSPDLFPRYQTAVLKKLHRRKAGLGKSNLPENKQQFDQICNILNILENPQP